MYAKEFICLANSYKRPSGRCLAGKEIDGNLIGDWVRPVSARDSREVSENERMYPSGQRAKFLDKVQVRFLRPYPIGHQIENHVLDEKYHFGYGGRATLDEVVSCLDNFDASFWAGGYSTNFGIRDKVPANHAPALGSSLKLIRVPELIVHVELEHNSYDNTSRRKVRGEFTYVNQQYKLSITDPEALESFMGQADGLYIVTEPILCVSVAEVWNGYAFRVIASVIRPESFAD